MDENFYTFLFELKVEISAYRQQLICFTIHQSKSVFSQLFFQLFPGSQGVDLELCDNFPNPVLGIVKNFENPAIIKRLKGMGKKQRELFFIHSQMALRVYNRQLWIQHPDE